MRSTCRKRQMKTRHNHVTTLTLVVNEEDTEEEETDEDEKASVTGARPRRMSEVQTPKKSEPIPPASSLYIFSSTNKYGLCSLQCGIARIESDTFLTTYHIFFSRLNDNTYDLIKSRYFEIQN